MPHVAQVDGARIGGEQQMQYEPVGPMVRNAAVDVAAADEAVVVMGEPSVAAGPDAVRGPEKRG